MHTARAVGQFGSPRTLRPFFRTSLPKAPLMYLRILTLSGRTVFIDSYLLTGIFHLIELNYFKAKQFLRGVLILTIR